MSTGTSVDAAAAGKVSILLDGYPLPFPVQPAVMKGTTMVPFRAISEALGIMVTWNQQLKQITATKNGNSGSQKVVLTLGSKTALVNGVKIPLAAAPQTLSNSTMIPLSFFSQQFGAQVQWNQASKTVSITSPREDMYTLGFYAISSYDESSLMPGFDAVAFGWSHIDENGQFTTSGPANQFGWPQAAGAVTPESLVQQTSQIGDTPYLMVYGVDGKGQLTQNIENEQLQKETISKISALATDKGFKGVVLDLEGLGLTGDKAKVKAQYNTFVKNIASELHAKGLKLSVAVPPPNGAYGGYDYGTLAKLADDLILMAYAYGDQKSPEPDAKVDEAVRLALKQASRDKLVLGISMSSENADSVDTKIGLAKRYGLKGIAVWRLGIIGADWTTMNQSVKLD
ncbi:stalk domain-containing protein [Paenibacillus sp. JX-17]|uniref:Stalk domain-containing protein n=2 Tax=Paenibacillus lacisoli TaxID=3064525 RepID=A0ABT9CCG2_9BACL|nr:stalk domain-containing protein [Paenibacillus sp. JX-17]MDO7906945.1 stalk domain-containing protein [Paenibacillus sp. JX-17]